MALDERARHELFSRVESALGPEAAETLMGYLPPVGWADVVTKHDLDRRLELTEQRVLATVRGEMAAHTRTLLFAMIGVMLALTSAILAAVRL